MKEGTLLNGRYQLLEKLGTGGMAEVFRARDPILDRIVAIKVLRQDYSNNPQFQEHFRTEARAAANLSHPNIVTVHDFGFAEDLLYIVMEYIPGKDLKQLIRQRGRFTVEQGIPLITQACAGLGYAHRAGLVHCDVKPHNMLVAPDGRLKVTDFGIARALATMMPGEKADVVWGSPLYFSPEQARGESPVPASDVYSLGVVMYELLSGSTPFTAMTADELARLHVSAQPIPIREYVPEIPAALEEIISKVLSKEPSARYRTADQLGRVLLRFGTLPEIPAPESDVTEKNIARENTPAPKPKPEPVKQRFTPPPPAVKSPEPQEDEPGLGAILGEIDWLSVGLGLLAVIAVGGLIPFWMMVYFAYNPPLP